MTSAYDEWRDSDEDFSDAEDANTSVSEEFRFKPSYLLIAIDAAPSMFTLDGNSDKSHFSRCLDACDKIVNSLLFVQGNAAKGPVAVIFADNKASRANFLEFEHSVPEKVAELDALRQLSNKELSAKYGRKEDFDLGDFFLFCKNKFTAIKADVYRRNIVYLTNDDEPVQNNDKKMKYKVINEVQKFNDLQISLYTYTFNRNFDNDLFYAEILKECNSDGGNNLVQHLNEEREFVEKLDSFVQQRYPRYRQQLYLCHGQEDAPKVSVSVTRFMRSSKGYKTSFVTREQSKPVIKRMTGTQFGGSTYAVQSAGGTAKNILPIRLDSLEKDILENTNIPTGLSLVCVAEKTYRDGWLTEAPFYVQKDDRDPNKETSTDCFNELWKYCREKKRCLVCLFKRRTRGPVKITELEPKVINDSPTFIAHALPYCCDVNVPRLKKEEDAAPRLLLALESEQEAAVNDLVDALTFDFDISKFRDPVALKEEAYLRSQLLERPLEDTDEVFPSDSAIDAKVAPFVDRLRELDLLDVVAEKRPAKRPVGGTTQPRKRGKKE